jgi:hypothetical protein
VVVVKVGGGGASRRRQPLQDLHRFIWRKPSREEKVGGPLMPVRWMVAAAGKVRRQVVGGESTVFCFFSTEPSANNNVWMVDVGGSQPILIRVRTGGWWLLDVMSA